MNDKTKPNDESNEVEALRRENEALRRRLAEFEAIEAARPDRDLLSLQDRMQLLDAVVDNSPSIIFVKAPDGKYLLVNRQTAAGYRLAREKLIGRYDADFFPPEAVDAMQVKDRE